MNITSALKFNIPTHYYPPKYISNRTIIHFYHFYKNKIILYPSIKTQFLSHTKKLTKTVTLKEQLFLARVGPFQSIYAKASCFLVNGRLRRSDAVTTAHTREEPTI